MQLSVGAPQLQGEIRATLVPTVLDGSSRGERAYDIYSLLVKERILFLGQEVDDQVANLLAAEMLYLESQDPERDIHLYINSPGRLAYGGLAIYDVMQQVSCSVATTCIGMSAAAMILCGGAPGKRLALPSAKIMIHQGTAGTRGAPRDTEIQLREVMSNTRRMTEIVAHHSGRPIEQVERDIDRDYFLTAQEAVEYGLIDAVLAPRKGISAARAVAEKAALPSVGAPPPG